MATTTEVIYQGTTFQEFLNLPLSVDQQFAVGEVAEFQIRFPFHIPGLEDTVRLLLEPLLGDDLIAVRMPDVILRIRWIRNAGPLAIVLILGTIVVFTIMSFFVLFKFFPEVAKKMALWVIGGAAAVALVYGLTQRRW